MFRVFSSTSLYKLLILLKFQYYVICYLLNSIFTYDFDYSLFISLRKVLIFWIIGCNTWYILGELIKRIIQFDGIIFKFEENRVFVKLTCIIKRFLYEEAGINLAGGGDGNLRRNLLLFFSDFIKYLEKVKTCFKFRATSFLKYL